MDPALVFVVGGSPGANIGAMSILADKRMIENFSLDPKLVFQPVNGIFLNGIYDLTDFCERNPKEREGCVSFWTGQCGRRSCGRNIRPGIMEGPGGIF